MVWWFNFFFLWCVNGLNASCLRLTMFVLPSPQAFFETCKLSQCFLTASDLHGNMSLRFSGDWWGCLYVRILIVVGSNDQSFGFFLNLVPYGEQQMWIGWVENASSCDKGHKSCEETDFGAFWSEKTEDFDSYSSEKRPFSLILFVSAGKAFLFLHITLWNDEVNLAYDFWILYYCKCAALTASHT